MFKSKSEVDRHVHNCLKKINNETERSLRCFSFAKLYFTVGDYDQAYRYISSYLTVKPKSAEGYQLLGKSLEKLGKVDAALEAYRNSLQIDPKQNNLVIKVCELLSSDNVELDLSGARYFCDLAQSFDPNNPAVHSLKERLITTDNENPLEVAQLLLKELEVRPADVNLRVRLLKHFIQNNMIKEAYKHATSVEEKNIPSFYNSINWYENFAEVLVRFKKDVSLKSELTWEFWLLSVSVLERLVALSLDDRHNIKGATDYVAATFNFDQMLYKASQNLASCTDRQLVSTFLVHYHAQLHFHLSTLIFKQAKKDVIQFKEASNIVLPTLFTAYHSPPPDLQSLWFIQSSEKTKSLIQSWYKAACFRCSQAGHILSASAKDNKSLVLEKATKYSSGIWREHLYKKIFVKRDQHVQMSTSFFVVNNPSLEPSLKLPDTSELLRYDEIAQLSFPESLHHYIWIALNSNISEINVTTFEGMQYSTKNLTNCSAESLNLLDIYAFVYCATLCAKFKLRDNKAAYYNLLPAAITDNLATVQQCNFLESAYKMYRNETSSHLGDVRILLIKGIEVVRCVGHHGLDARMLVNLAKLFEERAQRLAKQSEIDFAVARAELYWKTAFPFLEKIKNNQKITYLNNRLFELKSDDELTLAEANSFAEKGKLFIGNQLMKQKEYDQALAIFEQMKDPYASFNQFAIYKQLVDRRSGETEGDAEQTKREVLVYLCKAKDCLYLTLDRLREPSVDKSHPLNYQLGTELDEVERMISAVETGRDDIFSEGNRSFDVSIGEQYISCSEDVTRDGGSYKTRLIRSLNQSTPIRHDVVRQEARPSPERLDAQIRQIMTSRDAVFSFVSEQNKQIADVQKNLLEKLNVVVSDLNSIKKDVESLKDISKSVNDIKISVEDFQNVADVIQEMKKELTELKKNDAKNQLSEEDLYLLDPDYGVDYNVASNVAPYNPAVPAAYPNYQAARIPNPNHVAAAYGPPVLYPGLYPGLSYTYAGLNLAQPGSIPFLPDQQASNIPSVAPHLIPGPPPNLGLEGLTGQTLSHAALPPTQLIKELPKDIGVTGNPLKLVPVSAPFAPASAKAPPVNVVITTSDPLPTENTLTSQPVLSVTIPPQHIKANFFKAASTTSTSILTPPGQSIIDKSKIAIQEQDKSLNKSGGDSFNNSNVSITSPEEHEPKVDFKPVIPLPDEVPVNTGEECETELFCCRAKLFRHVNVNGVKEWKERGVGNLKILNNPESGKTRILMRRDQVLKICANHFITKDMALVPTSNNDKAYMWAAQDFSDGEIIRETFCVKFKAAEEAKKFFETFESAKITSAVEPVKKPVEKQASNASQQNGASLGGFVFTGTPTFKPKDIKPPAAVTEVKDANKNSPFSTFYFGKSDFKNSGFNAEALTFSPLVIAQEKKDAGDRAPSPTEEFVPTAEFKPVIPLPELVEIKTGEENSEILFEARTKLFRYDTSGELKEWKERGVGTIKILKDKYVRLLMRRDQVHKVCCNHRVLKDMVFKANSNNAKAIVWQAQDFSEGVLKTEMFTARFKTEEIANQFLLTLDTARSSLDGNNGVSTDSKTEQPPTFQDAFKPKPGEWECKTCLINNAAHVVACAACNAPKESTSTASTKSGFTFNFKNVQSPGATKIDASGFGDSFKAAPGSWECKACMVRNEASAVSCAACNSSKEPGPAQQQKNVAVAKFNFGPSGAQSKGGAGFGDAFKSKPGSWECKACMIRNEAGVVTCVACGTLKEGESTQSVATDKTAKTPEQKFVFGIPNTPATLGGQLKITPISAATVPPAAQTANVSEQKWTFGIPLNTTAPVALNEETTIIPLSGAKPNSTTSFSFISPTKQEFEFKQKPARRISQGNDESDADGSYVEEEEDNIYFKPVIPLPNKVQVKTGEEEEDTLYCHRAKLFRFVNGEWKERGLGDIKILKNRSNGKLRVVMRREQVLKICLNHTLTKNIEYVSKDEKSLMFAAADFSEGELINEQFCVRFKNPEIAEDFKKAVGAALDGISYESKGSPSESSDEIEVTFETRVTPEEEEQALKLGLPPKFMSYKQLPDCACEQCKKDDEYLKDLFPATNLTDKPKKPTVKFSLPANTALSSAASIAEEKVSGEIPSKDPNKSAAVSSLLKPPILVTQTTKIPSASTFSWPSSTTASFFSPGSNSFGSGNSIFSNTNIFGNSSPKKDNTAVSGSIFNSVASTKPAEVKPETTTTATATTTIFSPPVSHSKSIFSMENVQTFKPFATNTSNIFGQNTARSGAADLPPNIFAPDTSGSVSIFGNKTFNATNLTGDKKTTTGFLFGKGSIPNVSSTAELTDTDEVVLKCDSDLSFASLAATSEDVKPAFSKTDDKFSFLGAGAPVFGSLQSKTTAAAADSSRAESDDENNTSAANEEYDPHYEPIVPLPDAITVTTGEENETVLFNERAKLFRFDTDTKEWKERGVGQLKVLYHPEKNTYRLLLRREQVFKVVLNQLITSNFELQPMLTSDKAWMWAGYNYTDDENSFEKLAVRFKNQELANQYRDVIKDTIKKLLDVSTSRKDVPVTVQDFDNGANDDDILNVLDNGGNDDYEYGEDVEEEDEEGDDDDDERTIMFVKECTLSELDSDNTCHLLDEGYLQVYYDPELYAARISVTDNDGGLLSNTLIAINTLMDINKNECSWKAVEWAHGTPTWRHLKVTFDSEPAAEEFHSNYLESLNYAQQVGLIDEIPLDCEPDD